MSSPTQELVKEHSAISAMLLVLQTVCNRIEANADVPASDLSLIVDFFSGFADGCHHKKEELQLFPGLERAGVPRQNGPIGVMLAEHELGRKYIRGMKAAITALSSGDIGAGRAFVSDARAYIGLLGAHILKENNVLFPMAERSLSEEAKREIAEGFRQVELQEVGEGRHEHYHTVMDELRTRYPVA